MKVEVRKWVKLYLLISLLLGALIGRLSSEVVTPSPKLFLEHEEEENQQSSLIVWEEDELGLESSSTLLIATLDGKLFGLDSESGEKKWTISTGSPLYSTRTNSLDFLGSFPFKFSFILKQILGGKEPIIIPSVGICEKFLFFFNGANIYDKLI